MFSRYKHLYFCVILYIITSQSCKCELVLNPALVLYSPGEPEYTDVVVKQEHDNLTLVCELPGDSTHRSYVWNYVGKNATAHTGTRLLMPSPAGVAPNSTLQVNDLQLTDSGQYMCSAPPFSVTKYLLVQTKGPVGCARGALSCGARCVLAAYVCDGRADCARGEDERAELCPRPGCARADRLPCASGRCIPARACCAPRAALCRQPACCDEHAAGDADAELPPLFEDRRAPDDYGFVQSTIYTVTACALIFMIAVVLLVSAVCKMQMKRAALRGYSGAAPPHYYHQAHSFPPCYEASLLEAEAHLPPRSPSHDLPASPSQRSRGGGLARLSAVFAARYSQVPSHPPDVEMSTLSPPAAGCAPPGSPPGGPPLSYADLQRRRNTLDRLVDHLDRQRLTLQLGRFQLSVPARGAGRAARADSPVAARDTFTRHGRTIRLLGAELQPPPYAAAGHKARGPPPHYLSRESLRHDARAAADVELPPRYDDLAAAAGGSGNDNDNGNGNVTVETLSSIIDNLPAIDSDVNANDADASANNEHAVRDNAARNDAVDV